MTELNKFGVIGLLQFQKGILPSHMAEFPFKKLQTLLHRRKRLLYSIDTKSDDKESVLPFLHTSSSYNTGMLGERCVGVCVGVKVERSLNKWNQGEII